MNVKQLKQFCKNKGIKGYSKCNKKQLEDMIENFKEENFKEENFKDNEIIKLKNIIKLKDNEITELNNLEKIEIKNNLEIDDLSLKIKNIKIQCSNDQDFWNGLMINPNNLRKPIEYLLKEFGTKEPCNRFDVGNTIEFIIGDYIKSCGFEVSELPNAKRFDIDIQNYKRFSIKYSSIGDITLHNSNSCINKDVEMKDTILLTPDKLYLISITELHKYNINVMDYIKNAGDSLKLKRKFLTELKNKNYSYIYDINIKHNKKECKNRLCSKIFYKEFTKEYNLKV